MFKPGFLASAFVKGKRLLYLHPAQLYLFISVVFFFIFNFYARDTRVELDENMQNVLSKRSEKLNSNQTYTKQDSLQIADSLKLEIPKSALTGRDKKELTALDSLPKIEVSKENVRTSFNFNERELDSLEAIGATNEEIYRFMGMDDNASYLTRKFYAQVLKFYKTMGLGQIYQTFIDSIPLALFFLLPIFALLLKLFFYNKGRYAHHLVFSFYYFSFLFTVFSIIFAVNRWLAEIPDSVNWLIALVICLYLILAVRKFYGQGWFWSIVKSGVVSFLFLILVLPFSFTILGLITFFFY